MFAASLFLELLKGQTASEIERILSWDLAVYDTQKGSFWGQKTNFMRTVNWII